MARAAKIAADRIAAGDADVEFYRAKLATAAFYASHVLSQAAWFKRQIVDGSGDVMRLTDEQFELDRKRCWQRLFNVMSGPSGVASHPRQSAGQRALVRVLREAAGGAARGATPTIAVGAVVLTGANGLFSAGADVNDFNAEIRRPDANTIRDVIAAVEAQR